MIDKENPNIQYKQINIPLALVIILFCAIYIMGLFFSIFYFVKDFVALYSSEENNLLVPVILLAFLNIYLIYSFVVNAITFKKVMILKWDEKPKLYLAFLFSSLNIPSGIIMFILFKKQENEKNQ